MSVSPDGSTISPILLLLTSATLFLLFSSYTYLSLLSLRLLLSVAPTASTASSDQRTRHSSTTLFKQLSPPLS